MTTTTIPTLVTKFIPGYTYSATSPCDHECVWTFTVVARTAKFVTIDDGEKLRRVGVKVSRDAEYALPFGSYSMCPVIRAERLA